MKELKFTLTVEETNKVLVALSNMPYSQVAGLIAKVQEQAKAQEGEQKPEHNDG